MSFIKEEELEKILPKDGPSIEEVNKYLDKYNDEFIVIKCCLLYTSPSPRDKHRSRMPSSA